MCCRGSAPYPFSLSPLGVSLNCTSIEATPTLEHWGLEGRCSSRIEILQRPKFAALIINPFEIFSNRSANNTMNISPIFHFSYVGEGQQRILLEQVGETWQTHEEPI
jgi:hypothetical protein